MSLRRDVQKLTNSTKWSRIQGKFQDCHNEMATPSGSSQQDKEDFDKSPVKSNENIVNNDGKMDTSKNCSNTLHSQSKQTNADIKDDSEKHHVESSAQLLDDSINNNSSDSKINENKSTFAAKSFSEITEEHLNLLFRNKSGNRVKIETTATQKEGKKNDSDSIILGAKLVENALIVSDSSERATLSVQNDKKTEACEEAKQCHIEATENFQSIPSQHEKTPEGKIIKCASPEVVQKNLPSHRKNTLETKHSHSNNMIKRRTSRHSCPPRTSFRDRGKYFHYPRPQKPKGKVKNLIRKFEEISSDNLLESQDDNSHNNGTVALDVQPLNQCCSNTSEKTHCLKVVKSRDDSGISEGEESTSPKHITETINHRLIENYDRYLNETNAKNSGLQDLTIKNFLDSVPKHIYCNYPWRTSRENRRSRSKSPRPSLIIKKPMPLPRSSQYFHVSDCYSGYPCQQRELVKKKSENSCPKLSQSEEEWADISEEEKDVISYSQKIANVSKRFYDLKIPVYCSESVNLYDCCSPTRQRWIHNASYNKGDSTGDSSWETLSLHQDEEDNDDKSSSTSSEHHYEAINDLKFELGDLSIYRNDQQSPDDFIRESFNFLDTHSADESDDIESPSAINFNSHPMQNSYRYNERKANNAKDKLSPSWDSRDSITETVLMYQELSSFRRSFNKKAFKKILKENELESNKLKKQSLFSKNSKEILNFYVPWFSRNDHNQKPESYESVPEQLNIDSPEIKEKKKGKYFTLPHPKKLSRSEQHLDNLNSPNDIDMPQTFDSSRRASDGSPLSAHSKDMELTEGNQTVSKCRESFGTENTLQSQSSSPTDVSEGSRVSVISCTSCGDSDYICRKDLESTPNSSSSEESIHCVRMRKPIDVKFIKVRKRVESTGSEHSYFQLSEVSRPLIDNDNASYEQILVSHQNDDNCVDNEQQDNSVLYCELNSGDFRQLSSESHMSIEQLSTLSHIGEKKLWSDLPEVQKSGVLEKMSAQELKLQEAIFNVTIFEGTYLRLLQTYQQHFVQSSSNSDGHSLCKIISWHEWHLVFSDSLPIIEVSERLVADIQYRWDENYTCFDITDILYENIKTHFHVYVKYCSNKPYRDRMLKVLMTTKPKFAEVTRYLEASSECQGLLLEEFLMLPAHHISDLLVLIEEIYHWLPTNSPKCSIYNEIMEILRKLKLECEKGALQMERMEEMLLLAQQIIFKDCKPLSLISVSRWLLKRGEMTHLICDIPNKRTFGKSVRWNKVSVYIFLFNDYLIVTKQRSDEKYNVLDYCPKNIAHAEFIDDVNCHSNLRIPSNCKYLLRFKLWSNHKNKTVEMILNCPSESDKIRWGEALISDEATDLDMTERQDHFNVQCTQPYAAQQADELTLFESDVVKVLRKVGDGWYKGKHMKDGNIGWFPASHVTKNIHDFKVNHLSLGHKYSQVSCASSSKIPISPR